MRTYLTLENKLSDVFENILKFTDGTIVEEYYPKEIYRYVYKDHRLICTSHDQGYHCDYIILGELLNANENVRVIIDTNYTYDKTIDILRGNI